MAEIKSTGMRVSLGALSFVPDGSMEIVDAVTDHVRRQRKILDDIVNERDAQDALFGVQDLPDGTGITGDKERADSARHVCDVMFERGKGTYRDVFWEEVNEAMAESDPANLRAELVQAVAVGVKWLEAIDRREGR